MKRTLLLSIVTLAIVAVSPASAQKGGKDLGAMLKKLEHQADGFQQGGKGEQAGAAKLQPGAAGGMDALTSLLPKLTEEVAQLTQTVMQMARLAQAM